MCARLVSGKCVRVCLVRGFVRECVPRTGTCDCVFMCASYRDLSVCLRVCASYRDLFSFASAPRSGFSESVCVPRTRIYLFVFVW